MRLPDSWAEVRLTDICELNPRLLGEDRPSGDTAVSFVPMSAVDEQNGVIANPECRTYAEVAKGYTSFRERDVLFAKVTPCMENGKAAIARDLKNGFGFGSTEFHVLRPTDAVLPDYIFSFIRQKAFRDRASSAFVGTGGLQRVPTDFLSRVKIPLPTLPEQQRIVDLLQQAELVAMAKQSIGEKIDQLVKAAYWQHFSDWYTTEGLINPVRIRDYVADSQYGVSEAMEEQGAHAVLRMNSITTNGWMDLSDLKYANLSEKDIRATELQDGDLLFNRTNSRELVGKCALWRPVTGQFSYASYLIRLRLKPKMLPEYLWATLNSAYGKYRLFNSAKQAVSMANVSPTDLGRMTVPLPPLPLQEKFAEFVRAFEGLRARMLANADAFAELKNVVLGQALTGQLTSQWRKDHSTEVREAARSRDVLLREQGAKITNLSANRSSSASLQADATVLPKRHWLWDELSEFQRQVMAAFAGFSQDTGQPLLVEDPEIFARFCDDSSVTEHLQAFGDSLGNRIRRTLSQLASLGLIAKVTLPKENPETGEREYLKAFRLFRVEEYVRKDDVQSLREVLSSTTEQKYYFEVELDFETSASAGAIGMFQVISLKDNSGKSFSHLVDQGQHYASLDDLSKDIANALSVGTMQIHLEEV